MCEISLTYRKLSAFCVPLNVRYTGAFEVNLFLNR